MMLLATLTAMPAAISRIDALNSLYLGTAMERAFGPFFMTLVVAALLTILGWIYLYMRAHGQTMWTPAWIDGVRIRLYVLFMNRLYADELYQLLEQTVMRLIHRLDKREQGWSR